MNKNHRHAGRVLVAALLSVLSCTAAALPTPPAWTSENYKLWYSIYQDQGNDVEGYAPSASGSSIPSVSQTHQLGSSFSSGLISFEPVTSTYTMSVHTIGDSTPDDAYTFSDAYMSASFNASAGSKLYVSYSLTGKALAVEGGDYNASGVESSIRINGVEKFALGNGSGLYNDEGGNTGDLEQVNIVDGLMDFDLVGGSNSFYWDMSAWSEKYGASRTETWLTATFRFSTTPFLDPPGGTVPEPNGLALFALGLVGLAGVQRRRRPM